MEVQQKEKTLDLAISQIEKQFGQGAIMRMGEDTIIKKGTHSKFVCNGH